MAESKESIEQRIRDIAERAITTVNAAPVGSFVDIDFFVKEFENALTELVEL